MRVVATAVGIRKTQPVTSRESQRRGIKVNRLNRKVIGNAPALADERLDVLDQRKRDEASERRQIGWRRRELGRRSHGVETDRARDTTTPEVVNNINVKIRRCSVLIRGAESDIVGEIVQLGVMRVNLSFGRERRGEDRRRIARRRIQKVYRRNNVRDPVVDVVFALLGTEVVIVVVLHADAEGNPAIHRGGGLLRDENAGEKDRGENCCEHSIDFARRPVGCPEIFHYLTPAEPELAFYRTPRNLA